MGNCQAAEVATVVIQHPGEGLTERAYWALSAGAVMAANPGHYVAAVITSPPDPSSSGTGAAPVKHLKLVRPDDTLLLGRVYRLVSFEEVLREFTSKRHVKLSRVRIKAKDEVGEEEAKKNPRRRGASSSGERKESDRSLAKVMRQAEEEAVPEPHEPCHADRPRGAGAAARGGHRPAVRTAMEARATEHRRRVTLPAPLHPVRSGRWKSTQRQQLRLCEIASCKTDSVL